MTGRFDPAAMAALRDDVQGGVVARWQLRELGAQDHDIRRLVRRRELTVITPGVYAAHTGVPTWHQRAWAAVLACWPAALTGRSALPKPNLAAPVEVMVAMERTVRAPAGVIVHRRARFDGQVDWGALPPRQLAAEAAIDAAAAVSENEAFALLADLVQTRVVRTRALLEAVRRRSRLRHRVLLEGVLEDLATGACSVLEREYLRRVERAHRLPSGDRQVPDSIDDRPVVRDAAYPAYGLIVELDGRAFHNTASARDADHGRDLAAAAARGLRTVRITYGQVLGDPCTTAARIADLLRAGGWPGRMTPCPRCRHINSKPTVTR